MSDLIDDAVLSYPIGSRIKIGYNMFGTVKYVGQVDGYTGTMLGVEWDDSRHGSHDGTINGKFYFQTQHFNAGSFVCPTKVDRFATLEEIARERYLAHTELKREALFQLIVWDKERRKLEELTEVNVDHWPVNSAGCLKAFQMLVTLNANSTLIWNWDIVADIVKQAPTLLNLNLSCNRLLLPTEDQVNELKPVFLNLQCIHMRNCGFTEWKDVLQTARLWPHVLILSLQGNSLAGLSNCEEVFTNLKDLDLSGAKIKNFFEVCKLGNIRKLASLNLLGNGIEEIRFPECEPNEKLQIFMSLEQLNLRDNPIRNEEDAFNELDKLPRLKRLYKTPPSKDGFDETFSKAASMISQLESFNKMGVTAQVRRTAGYDMWLRYASEWLKVAEKPGVLHEFYRKHRTYAAVVKEYGSPGEYLSKTDTDSNLINIHVQNPLSGELWEKKVPLLFSVEALQWLITNRFGGNKNRPPRLSYVDENHPGLIVSMENPKKTLQFYSVQDGNIIMAKW